MSITERHGLLGGQAIYLRNDEDVPYVRSKVPVLPQRSDIEGDTEGVSPDTLLRHWSQEDFSAGAGYPKWESNKEGFEEADGAVWDSIEQVVQPGPRFLIDDAFTDGGPFYVRQGVVVTAGNGGTDKVSFGSTDASPTWATDGFSIKAASTPTTVGLVSDGGTAKVHSAYANGDLYLNNVLWKAFGGSNGASVTHQELVYFLTSTTLDVMDNFTTPTTSTAKVTTPINTFLLTAPAAPNFLTASDVGPVWLVKSADERISVWEYNVAADTDSILGELPKGATASSIVYDFGGYWVPYVQKGGSAANDAELWLWYLVNGVQGRVGPFHSSITPSATTEPFALGTSNRNEIVIWWSDQLWAYDVDATSLNMLVDTTQDTVSGSTGVDYGFAFGNVIALTHDNGKVAVYERSGTRHETGGTAFDITLGAWDGGYPGVLKQLSSVTVSTLPLEAGTSVKLAYRFDSASSFNGMTTVHDTEGATSFTWYPSLQFAAQSGDLVQLKIRLVSETAFNRGPYVRKVSASVMPDEAFIEWDLAIDLGDDRSGRLDSKVTADWLWGLGQETTFVDPWSVREHEAGETHNVRVLERQLGPVGRDGPQFARVKLRKVERV